MALGLAGRVKRGYALQSGKGGFLGRGKKVKEKKVKIRPAGGKKRENISKGKVLPFFSLLFWN